ncbi:MAG: DUF1552 domain-containing protein [Vicinamibacterales bacterium]
MGGCEHGYSCVYTDSISWARADEPLPMIRDPRTVFDQLFGVGATAEERAQRRREDCSILYTMVSAVNRLEDPARRGRPRAVDRSLLEDIREIERRIQKVWRRSTRAGSPRAELPGAPAAGADPTTST